MRLVLSLATASLALASARGAHAQQVATTADPTRLVWRPEWQKFDRTDAALTGTLAAGTLVFAFTTTEAPPDYRGPVLFDRGVRDGIRAHTSNARQNAERVGDKLYQASLLYPFVVDVVGVALVARRSSEVAAQMALIDAEAFAITGFLGFAANAGIRRQRPEQPECASGGSATFPTCRGNTESDTFFSGRTSIAFTGAALTCAHHYYLPLYRVGDSRAGDVIACVGAMGAATAAGTLRLVADQHYATDVVVGAGIGLASGLLVPLYHYRARVPPARAYPSNADTAHPLEASWTAVPMLSPTAAGLGAVGTF